MRIYGNVNITIVPRNEAPDAEDIDDEISPFGRLGL
jgi:hypothetical protein